jgi:hypothetical protein
MLIIVRMVKKILRVQFHFNKQLMSMHEYVYFHLIVTFEQPIEDCSELN